MGNAIKTSLFIAVAAVALSFNAQQANAQFHGGGFGNGFSISIGNGFNGFGFSSFNSGPSFSNRGFNSPGYYSPKKVPYKKAYSKKAYGKKYYSPKKSYYRGGGRFPY